MSGFYNCGSGTGAWARSKKDCTKGPWVAVRHRLKRGSFRVLCHEHGMEAILSGKVDIADMDEVLPLLIVQEVLES